MLFDNIDSTYDKQHPSHEAILRYETEIESLFAMSDTKTKEALTSDSGATTACVLCTKEADLPTPPHQCYPSTLLKSACGLCP